MSGHRKVVKVRGVRAAPVSCLPARCSSGFPVCFQNGQQILVNDTLLKLSLKVSVYGHVFYVSFTAACCKYQYMWREVLIPYCFSTGWCSAGAGMLTNVFAVKYFHLSELHINKCLIAKKKTFDCCLWLHHKQNRCKWFFFLVLCAELQSLEKTVPSKPIYVLYFAILLSAQNPSSPCHSIMYSSLLDIFPAIFLSRPFVPSSINTVDQDLCFGTKGLVLCT